MLTLSRSTTRTAQVFKVLGLGGAGCQLLERILQNPDLHAGCVAMNTDMQSLHTSHAPDKVQLGRETTRGLGAGGAADVGYAATEEATEEVRSVVEGTDVVFLLAGLGGGTGSGAAPLVAHLARSSGALVAAFVTLPFAFEGAKRGDLALQAVAQLAEQADMIVCFENDRMLTMTEPQGDARQAFLNVDEVVADAVNAVAKMVSRRGLLSIDLGDLMAVMRGQDARVLFGRGTGVGQGRGADAIRMALESPLLQGGERLRDAHTLLVQVSAAAGFSLREVESVFQALRDQIGNEPQIKAAIVEDDSLVDRLEVLILASTGAPLPVPMVVPALDSARRLAAEVLTLPATKSGAVLTDVGRSVMPPRAAPKLRGTITKKEEKAEQMPLEPVNRGRFDKGEPTIVDGQDLDIPTFLRKNLKMK